MYNDVFVVGRSLGSGVATYVASQSPSSRLSDSKPFDSVKCPPKSNFLLSYLDLTERQVLILRAGQKAIDSKVFDPNRMATG